MKDALYFLTMLLAIELDSFNHLLNNQVVEDSMVMLLLILNQMKLEKALNL